MADVFDSLCHERVYKEAWPFEKAVAFIESQSGRKFDPTLVKIFVDNLDEVKGILTLMKDKNGFE